jgi:peptide/nickel transport system substrate-binding protein
VKGNQLSFDLSEPDTRFDLLLSSSPLLFKASGTGQIGTGKFCVRSASSSEIVLMPNRFHAQPPDNDVVLRSLKPGTGEGSLVEALNAGEIDLAPSLSWTDLSALQKVSKITKPINALGLVYLNTQTLTDLTLRQALVGAIDSREIAKAAFQNNGTLEATGFLPADFVGAASAKFGPATLPSVAGAPHAVRLRTMFTSRSYLPFPTEAAQVLKAQLERAGYRVDLVVSSSLEEYQRCISSGDYDVLLSGNIAESEDPAEFLYSLFASAAVPTRDKLAGACNFSRVHSQKIDAQLSRFRATRDQGALSELAKALRLEALVVPVTQGRAVMAHSWKVKNVLPTMASIVDLSLVQFRHTL